MSWGLNSKVTVFVETELCSSEYIKALKQGRRSEAIGILSGLRHRERSARDVSHVLRRQKWEGRGTNRCCTRHKLEEAGRSCPELKEKHSRVARFPSAGAD